MKICCSHFLLVALNAMLLPEAAAEKYKVHMEDPSHYFNNLMMSGEPVNEYGHRVLQNNFQTSGGLRSDVNADPNNCRVVGSSFMCDVTSRVAESTGAEHTDFQITFTCQLDAATGFDFRRSRGCQCDATAIHSDPTRPNKRCPCTICPLGFGRNPISIDCSADAGDPMIVGQCSSLDCDFGCNGTCAFDCSNSGPDCAMCANNPNAPTLAPTGGKSNGITNFSAAPAVPSVNYFIWTIFAATMLLSLGLGGRW